ncbi:hypothetical protein [Flavobacterium branchiophilum]|uniref:hypothetical protein n=1 Tax=Flavobacterium branchiophilum TaxID=55197 RepID=UPI0016807E53|nr:hypothetical protein [Flavobacterium branchiophilum]
MVTQTTYSQSELDKGKCTCCGEISDEILIEDGRCIECIEDEKFYDLTMQGL